MNQTRISFKELPARARQLSGSDMSKVFGGCTGWLQPCSSNGQCCPPATGGSGSCYMGMCQG
jgi:hypothetical protein